MKAAATAPAENYAFYTHLTKYFSNSAEHNFLLITINVQASARHCQGTQYSTRPNAISARLHTVDLLLNVHIWINVCYLS